MPTHEVNYDGIVGPTHHYGGLSPGNLASQRHAQQASNPRAAALEGLAKMKAVHGLGVKQAVLPPHDRPDVATLRTLGFAGRDDAAVLHRAQRDAPWLLTACASASAMWAANAATVSPGIDTVDGRVHVSPANLTCEFHRSLEAPFTAALLRALLPGETHFAHHPPLPGQWRFADEGAANHLRLAPAHGQPGVEAFVFGRAGDDPAARRPRRYAARQSADASAAVVRRHGLGPARALMLRQSPDAIDAGAFHNDVVAVSNERVLLYHERAFAEGRLAKERLREAYVRLTETEPMLLEIADDEVPLADAVESYLFNSQLLTVPGDGPARMVLLAPAECAERPRVRACLDRLAGEAGNPIAAVQYVDVRQSMRNGGGPACLRLRVVLDDDQLAAAHRGAMFSDALHDRLVDWVQHHYRDELKPADLADPALLRESRTALDELTGILGLRALYAWS